MPRQQLTFPDEEFSVAIHDAGMFSVKEINRLKILQDVIAVTSATATLVVHTKRPGLAITLQQTTAMTWRDAKHLGSLARTQVAIDDILKNLMIKAGLWIPRRQRPPKIHQLRYRRPCTGELIQIDGCDHHWFENRGRPCTALVYVDDATSRLMHLLFVKSESTFTYFEATRGYIEKYGKPMILYSDKASVFRVNNKHATTGSGETQFARAMRGLNIT